MAAANLRNRPVAPGVQLPGGTAIEQPPEPWFVAEITERRTEDEEENPLDPAQYGFEEVWLLPDGTTEPVTSGRTSDGYRNYALAYPGFEYAVDDIVILRPSLTNADLFDILTAAGSGSGSGGGTLIHLTGAKSGGYYPGTIAAPPSLAGTLVKFVPKNDGDVADEGGSYLGVDSGTTAGGLPVYWGEDTYTTTATFPTGFEFDEDENGNCIGTVSRTTVITCTGQAKLTGGL